MTGRKLSDVERWQAAGMVIGGMPYRHTTERFNVSHSIIVRLKQRVNQTGNVKERQRTGQLLQTTPREDFVIRGFQERSSQMAIPLGHY
jgi:transposase